MLKLVTRPVRFTKKEFESGLKIACEDARANAEMMATGFGRSVGSLKSVSRHSLGGYDHIQNEMQRGTRQPMLNEVDLMEGERVSLSENPKPAKFTISFHATYELILGKFDKGFG